MGQRGPGAKPVRRRQAQGLNTADTPAPPWGTRADRLIAFLEGLTITSGAYANQKLVLRSWQRKLLTRVYATDDAGHRPVRTAVISTARKSGKSTITAGLALAHLAGPEAVPRGQVIAAAADRNQASVVYNELKAFVLADAALSGRIIFREWNKTAEDTETGSIFLTASSDAKKQHGSSPVFFVGDEVAQWRSRDLLDALQTGQGAHREPLGIIISTRSVDPESPLEQLISYGQDVEAGAVEDPAFVSLVYTAPADLDPFDPAAWEAANPDMTPERRADIENLARQARRSPSMLPAFEAYVLNRPVALDERWLSAPDWDACNGTAEATGPCIGGLDLSGGSNDMTAFALYWPETNLLRAWGFMPAARVDAAEREDRAPYRRWAGEGHLVITPGRAIDRQWLGHWLARQTEGLELVSIAADRWMLEALQQELDRDGISLPIVGFGQGFKDMSPAVAALERLVLDGKVRHGGNALLRSAVANCRIEHDPAANRKIVKHRSRGRVDAAVASVMAVGLAERQPAPADFSFTGMVLGV